MINRRKKRSTKPKGKDPTKLRRTNVANSMLGLSVVLYPNEGEYSGVVMNNYVGFKALVHSPFDFAEVGGKGFAVEAQKEVIYDNKAKETLVPERGWKYQILPTKVHLQSSSPEFSLSSVLGPVTCFKAYNLIQSQDTWLERNNECYKKLVKKFSLSIPLITDD